MNMKFTTLLPAILLTAFISPVQAADFSFTGSFSADDDVQLFGFSVGSTSTVTLKTLSYAGGTNASGVVIAAGGFDPTLALFDSSQNFIASNDDGMFPDVGIDPTTASVFDTFLELSLDPGDYTVAISQFNNFFDGGIGDNISLGFIREGEPTFTFDDGFGSAPMFNDVDADARTGNWAFDILNVDSAVVPEPNLLAFVSIASALLCARRSRKYNERSS